MLARSVSRSLHGRHFAAAAPAVSSRSLYRGFASGAARMRESPFLRLSALHSLEALGRLLYRLLSWNLTTTWAALARSHPLCSIVWYGTYGRGMVAGADVGGRAGAALLMRGK